MIGTEVVGLPVHSQPQDSDSDDNFKNANNVTFDWNGMKEEDDDYVPCWRRVYTVCCFILLLIVGNITLGVLLVGKEKDRMYIVARIRSLEAELHSLEEANASLTEFNDYLMDTFGM